MAQGRPRRLRQSVQHTSMEVSHRGDESFDLRAAAAWELGRWEREPIILWTSPPSTSLSLTAPPAMWTRFPSSSVRREIKPWRRFSSSQTHNERRGQRPGPRGRLPSLFSCWIPLPLLPPPLLLYLHRCCERHPGCCWIPHICEADVAFMGSGDSKWLNELRSCCVSYRRTPGSSRCFCFIHFDFAVIRFLQNEWMNYTVWHCDLQMLQRFLFLCVTKHVSCLSVYSVGDISE